MVKTESVFQPFDPVNIVEKHKKTVKSKLHDPTVKEFWKVLDDPALHDIFRKCAANEYAGVRVYSDAIKDMCAIANKQGIKCGSAVVTYKNSSVCNYFNVFRIKSRGLVFIDNENKAAYNLDTFIGKTQKQLSSSLFMFPHIPHYVARTGKMRDIKTVKITW